MIVGVVAGVIECLRMIRDANDVLKAWDAEGGRGESPRQLYSPFGLSDLRRREVRG